MSLQSKNHPRASTIQQIFVIMPTLNLDHKLVLSQYYGVTKICQIKKYIQPKVLIQTKCKVCSSNFLSIMNISIRNTEEKWANKPIIHLLKLNLNKSVERKPLKATRNFHEITDLQLKKVTIKKNSATQYSKLLKGISSKKLQK